MNFKNLDDAHTFCVEMKMAFQARFDEKIDVTYSEHHGTVTWRWPNYVNIPRAKRDEFRVWLEGFAAGFKVGK